MSSVCFAGLASLAAIALAFVTLIPPSGSATHIYGVFGEGQIQEPTDVAELQIEYDGAVTLHPLELNWTILQPDAPNGWDTRSAAAYQQKIDAFSDLGGDARIVLDLGLQYPPAWVVAQDPLTDQYGITWHDRGVGHGDIPNVFWSPTVQRWTSGYISRIFRYFDFHERLWGVRTGWYYGENVFPPYRTSAQQATSFWAYDATAQRLNPVPGWKPGDPSTNNQAQVFYEWYVSSLAKAFLFIKSAVHAAGFAGHVIPVTPGGSVWHQFLPEIYAASLAPSDWNYLGTGDNWERLFPEFHSAGSTVLFWCSSMENDGSDEGGSDPWNWSSIHQMSYLAQIEGLPLMGENPGMNAPSDMAWAFEALAKNNLVGIMWIRESTMPDATDYKGVCPTCATIQYYQSLISQHL